MPILMDLFGILLHRPCNMMADAYIVIPFIQFIQNSSDTSCSVDIFQSISLL